MPISIRIDPVTESKLRQTLGQEGISLSEFVRDAINEKLALCTNGKTPYDKGAHLFGRHSSGETGRSENRKTMLKEKMRARHHHG